MVNGGEDNTLKPSRMDLFDYKYENAHLAGSYQDRFHTKNRKITSDRVDNHLPDNSI